MATFLDYAEPAVLIDSIAAFDRTFGPIPAEVLDAVGRSLAPTTREGTLRITHVSDDFYNAILGTPPSSPQLTWGVSITASRAVEAPCPRLWRHPLRWLAWNPFLTDGTLVTKMKLNDVKLRTGDGHEVASWEVDS